LGETPRHVRPLVSQLRAYLSTDEAIAVVTHCWCVPQENDMRLLKLSLAIAAIAGAVGLTATAGAQSHNNHVERSQSRSNYDRDVLGIPNGRSYDNRSDRRGDRRYDRSDRRNDRGYSNSRGRDDRRRGYSNARNCKTVWRHNRRVRVCR
jgi:hypothetical protein